jgi:hypothetical protein
MRIGRAPVTSQLSSLAAAGRTGMLRVPGDNFGTIYLRLGVVTGAEAHGAPDLASRLARLPTGTNGDALDALTRAWVIREAIADAALIMLAGAPRSARFTVSQAPDPNGAATMTVADLLAEVNRRQEVIRQLPTALTVDTAVVRNPRLRARRVHVSASQWALLARMNEPATPRELAIASGASVFATTLAVFRLIAIDLVAIVGSPQPDQRTISFIRASTS